MTTVTVSASREDQSGIADSANAGVVTRKQLAARTYIAPANCRKRFQA